VKVTFPDIDFGHNYFRNIEILTVEVKITFQVENIFTPIKMKRTESKFLPKYFGKILFDDFITILPFQRSVDSDICACTLAKCY
jgi:hypothetical protein